MTHATGTQRLALGFKSMPPEQRRRKTVSHDRSELLGQQTAFCEKGRLDAPEAGRNASASSSHLEQNSFEAVPKRPVSAMQEGTGLSAHEKPLCPAAEALSQATPAVEEEYQKFFLVEKDTFFSYTPAQPVYARQRSRSEPPPSKTSAAPTMLEGRPWQPRPPSLLGS